jgi:hypothetical protein
LQEGYKKNAPVYSRFKADILNSINTRMKAAVAQIFPRL